MDGENSFTCNCHPGYTGYLCQNQIDECESNPCQFGGHCEDLIAGYQCRCKPGTSGPNCEINVNECFSNPCRNRANCVDGISKYTCECLPGYAGQHCETNINECASNPCANGGRCMDLVDGFRCECPRGYYDARCLSDVDECASNPCMNGGRCEDGVNQFICHCIPGYGGKRCELDLDECGSNPCQHGGTCTDKLNAYSCKCVPGFTGINCETNIDDCAINPCNNGGSCIDLVNDYSCVCELPYTGRDCQDKLDPCSPNRCRNGARCSPSSNFLDFSCSCGLGYTGRLCDEDVDECVLSSPCRNGATCRNTNGSYHCICALGYEGRDCITNTDDCASFPCQNGGTCLDAIGDYTCLCVDGFGGKHCEIDIDECQSSPCHNGATCNQYVNSYTCTCPLGFSGMNCQTNDEDCTDSSCMNGGKCVDGINNYTCICQPGYTGSNCQYRINECDSHPCSNGGTCQDHVKYFTCHCPYGYTGKYCDSYVDWCSTEPCMNEATCSQSKNTYQCICAPGWTGKVCDVEMVSCNDAALRKGVNREDLCNNGTCEDIGNSHRCHCMDGYSGSYCQQEIDECESAPCQNGATCKNLVGSYACQCAQGFQGQNCELNVDDCRPNPCQNGGTCHDLVARFSCSCPPGTLGIICEINVEDCVPGACHNNGTCVDRVGGFECRCPPGFVGPRCEGDINECLSDPCSSPGTQDCVQLVNNYHCNCKPGYMGRHCEVRVDFCASAPCANGGICEALEAGHTCICPEGYYGPDCRFAGYGCESDPCQNGGACRVIDGVGYHCDCPSGTAGAHCELDTRDECASSPCQHGGTCQNRIGDYACYCLRTWTGKNCELYDPSFPGGIGRPPPAEPTVSTIGIYSVDIDMDRQRQKCIENGCREKAGNHHCDEECNVAACNYDGNDCSLGIDPWKNCTAPIDCRRVFMNGVCDAVCNNPMCLFDGRDCQKSLNPCNPIYDAYCQKHYANGHCDYGCNNEECNWDGLDCENEQPLLADGLISIVVLMDMQVFRSNIVAFLREIGNQLRTTLRVKKDEAGNDMIYPWKLESDSSSSIMFGRGSSGVIAYLEMDNRKCALESAECFRSANEAAHFLAGTAARHSLSKTFPIYQVRGVEGPLPDDEPSTNVKYVFIGVVIVLLAGLLIGVLVTAQRKRAQGITWFPEGFLRSSSGQRRRSRRRGPDGQEMRNLHKQPSGGCVDVTTGAVPGAPVGVGTGPGQAAQWSDDEVDLHPPKRLRVGTCEAGYASDHTAVTEYEEGEARTWTQQHLEVADMRHRPDPAILTPPSLEGGQDVDVRGPCGMTPLMVAAVRGGGIDTGEDEDDDGSAAAVITDLVAQGAELNATMDKTGETSLHLAARYARADAAKRLLDAGADANLQDNTGRTPLHAAVAADAMGVFQILLRNRATNLNARMHDGTTPLILAARLAIEGMVEDLINADADINAADNSGKTALHWAAAVNNTEAVNILLAHGANRDAQDDKDETPLFLAAREGSYEACKALLDNFANREITDHMDRLPRDVAGERLHHDIVRLLDEHVPRSPQMVTVIPNGPIIGSPNHHHHLITHPTVIGAGTKPSKSKKRPKPGANANGQTAAGGSSPTSPDTDGVAGVRRKPSVKKSGGKKPPVGTQPQSVESAASSLSPVTSLESPRTVGGPAGAADGSIPSPYDGSVYSNGGLSLPKQPPAYEDCVKGTAGGPLQSLRALGLDQYGCYGGLFDPTGAGQQQLQLATLQVHAQAQALSPPYSNQQSPPHSVSSPAASYGGSPSPAKSRPSLPTSPTHMAALRAATQQKHGLTGQQQAQAVGFDFPDLAGAPVGAAGAGPGAAFGLQQQYYHYLTPPSQHSEATPQHYVQAPDNFPTPSPESPGHWSSSSPRSASDWSEGMRSPAYATGAQHQKQAEAIYI